jgi:hypothetical protein
MGVTLRMTERAPRRRQPAASRATQQKRVVAVILSDGTVREVAEGRDAPRNAPAWSSGSIAGQDWVLWWERRAWRS